MTGAWPIVHLNSFLAVTGPKTDLWLVKTVGALIGVIGFTLLYELKSPTPSPSFRIICLGVPLALIAVDVWYVLQQIISPIYLMDALLEFLILSAWFFTLRKL